MLCYSNLAPPTGYLGFMVYNGQDTAALPLLSNILLSQVNSNQYTKWLYEFEMSLLEPAMTVGMRGLKVDEKKALELIKTFESECVQYAQEANTLITTTLCDKWTDFALGSAQQVKDALYGSAEINPCPDCGWTNIVETVAPYSKLLCDEDTTTNQLVYQRFKKAPRLGHYKYVPIKQRTKKCDTKHVYPGYNVKPYIHRDTKKPTIDKDSLQKLILREELESPAGTLAHLRLEYKAREKQQGFLKAPRSPNGYYPYGLNVGATETLRFSSDSNVFGEGSNSQNIDKRVENVFIPDAGYILMERDLKAAENFALYNYLNDQQAIDLINSSFDLHSLRAQLAYPDLEWPTDPDAHKTFASKTKLYDNLTLRDVGKKVGHSMERFGTKHTIARSCKIKLYMAEEVCERMRAALPGVFAGLDEFKYSLRHREYVEVEMGWGQWRFPVIGNPLEDDCAREMISQVLQSMVIMTAAKGFLDCYNDLDSKYKKRGVADFEMLRNKHDANEWQVRKGLEYMDKEVKSRMEFTSKLHNGREFMIPTSLAKVKDEFGNYLATD